MKKIYIPLVGALFLTGCATTVTMSQLPHNQYRAIALSSSQNDAVSAVHKKADAMCKEQGKSTIVLKESSKYQGTMTKDERSLAKVASVAAFATSGTHVSTDSDNDYRALLEFRCA